MDKSPETKSGDTSKKISSFNSSATKENIKMLPPLNRSPRITDDNCSNNFEANQRQCSVKYIDMVKKINTKAKKSHLARQIERETEY